MRPSRVLSEVGIGLRRNLTMTIAMIVTMSLSLALFGTGLLLRTQVNTMKDFWYDKVEVSVYLCGTSSLGAKCGGVPVTEQQRTAIGDQLRAMPQVQQVYYESQQDAYANFKKRFADSPNLVDNVTQDALPESYRVKLKDPTQFDVVKKAVQDQPGVELVQDENDLLKPFFRQVQTVQWLTLGLAVTMIVAAVLLVGNTIRVSAFSRRRETGIMRLVGASSLSIQLPFMLEGLLAGVAGAALAAGGLAALKYFAIDGVLRPTFRMTPFVGWSDVLAVSLWLLVAGVAISGVASFVALRRHLRV